MLYSLEEILHFRWEAGLRGTNAYDGALDREYTWLGNTLIVWFGDDCWMLTCLLPPFQI